MREDAVVMAAFHHPPSAERGYGRSIPSVSTYSPRPYPSDSYADVPSILIPSAFKGAGAKGARGTAAGDTATSRSSSYTRGAYAGRGALGLDSMAGMLCTRSLNSFCFGASISFTPVIPQRRGGQRRRALQKAVQRRTMLVGFFFLFLVLTLNRLAPSSHPIRRFGRGETSDSA